MPLIASRAGGSASAFGGLRIFALPPKNFDIISSVTADGTSSSLTLSAIPQTYSALELRMSVRSTRAGNATDGGSMRFNGNTGSVYNYSIQDANEGSFSAVNGATQDASYLFYYYPAATATANTFAVSNTSILDYTATNKHPAISARSFANNATPTNKFGFHGTFYNVAEAITSITLFSNTSSNFESGSTFVLYGLKTVA
jgi:hypothetical protein